MRKMRKTQDSKAGFKIYSNSQNMNKVEATNLNIRFLIDITLRFTAWNHHEHIATPAC